MKIDEPNFNQHRQAIINRLSRSLKSPVEVISDVGSIFLVIRESDFCPEKILGKFKLVGKVAYFEDASEVVNLSFSSSESINHKIIHRFLQFNLQGELFKKFSLWQPSTGRPFYNKKPIREGKVNIYRGFNARIQKLPDGKWGIAIDPTKKYSSAFPGRTYVNHKDFRKYYKGKHFIYKYPHNWYEIKIQELSDLNTSEFYYEHPISGQDISLIDDLRQRATSGSTRGFQHPELANLPNDSSVFIYYTNSMSPRGVPSGLCYEVFDTERKEVRGLHTKSIMPPKDRFAESSRIAETYLTELNYGRRKMEVSAEPFAFKAPKFFFPDFEVGNNEIIPSKRANYNPKQLAPKKDSCNKRF